MEASELAEFLDEDLCLPESRQGSLPRQLQLERIIQRTLIIATGLLILALSVHRGSSAHVSDNDVDSKAWLSIIGDSERSDEDKYIAGVDGINRCGAGSVPLSENQCRQMPDVFGGELHKPLVIHSAGDPQGCFRFWKWYYFNTHPSGAANKDRTPYCKLATASVPSHAGSADTSSLFCFALAALPDEEMPLLKLQHSQHAGIFACDAHSIYTEHTLELSSGVVTTGIGINTTCNMGGPFNTCLNSWIFIDVWKHVIKEGMFKRHKWTVKLDADAVFFPQRAIAALRGVPDPATGVYIINCKQGSGYGLHGPVEVFSKNAVQAYADGWEQCVKGPHRLHFGLWGEDFFIDECLKKLNVHRREDGRFLSEPHCDAPGTSGTFIGKGNDAWESCNYAQYVAFHPFKTASKYRECLANAEAE